MLPKSAARVIGACGINGIALMDLSCSTEAGFGINPIRRRNIVHSLTYCPQSKDRRGTVLDLNCFLIFSLRRQ